MSIWGWIILGLGVALAGLGAASVVYLLPTDDEPRYLGAVRGRVLVEEAAHRRSFPALNGRSGYRTSGVGTIPRRR